MVRKKIVNYLKAVFWDYPQFTDIHFLKDLIRKNKKKKIFLWILARFLEHGRVVDTFKFFHLDEIVENFPKVKLSPYSKKKWQRIIEVYSHDK